MMCSGTVSHCAAIKGYGGVHPAPLFRVHGAWKLHEILTHSYSDVHPSSIARGLQPKTKPILRNYRTGCSYSWDAPQVAYFSCTWWQAVNSGSTDHCRPSFDPSVSRTYEPRQMEEGWVKQVAKSTFLSLAQSGLMSQFCGDLKKENDVLHHWIYIELYR